MGVWCGGVGESGSKAAAVKKEAVKKEARLESQ